VLLLLAVDFPFYKTLGYTSSHASGGTPTRCLDDNDGDAFDGDDDVEVWYLFVLVAAILLDTSELNDDINDGGTVVDALADEYADAAVDMLYLICWWL
jgi:hypothetical protein